MKNVTTKNKGALKIMLDLVLTFWLLMALVFKPSYIDVILLVLVVFSLILDIMVIVKLKKRQKQI